MKIVAPRRQKPLKNMVFLGSETVKKSVICLALKMILKIDIESYKLVEMFFGWHYTHAPSVNRIS